MDPIYMFMGTTLGVIPWGKCRGLPLYLPLLPVPTLLHPQAVLLQQPTGSISAPLYPGIIGVAVLIASLMQTVL